MFPENEGTFGTLYYDRDGNIAELITFESVQTAGSICPEEEEDICPAAIWPGEDPISFEIDMKRRDHRKFMKMLHSWTMRNRREIRNRKRAKEQARRTMLKWNALHPHQEHSL